jgi:diacylglycerol kinase
MVNPPLARIGRLGKFMNAAPQIPQVHEEDRQVSRVQERPRRTWPRKFGDAFRGVKRGIRGQSSFSVHFFFAALVVAAAIVLRCRPEQWGLLLICIGLVFTAELFNSAVEALFRGLDEDTRARAWPCLDIAAGAVLVACIASAIVGCLVFLVRLSDLL